MDKRERNQLDSLLGQAARALEQTPEGQRLFEFLTKALRSDGKLGRHWAELTFDARYFGDDAEFHTEAGVAYFLDDFDTGDPDKGVLRVSVTSQGRVTGVRDIDKPGAPSGLF